MTLKCNISSEPSFPRSIFLAITPNHLTLLFHCDLHTKLGMHTRMCSHVCFTSETNIFFKVIIRRCQRLRRTHMSTYDVDGRMNDELGSTWTEAVRFFFGICL
jgi:hypothetical protein